MAGVPSPPPEDVCVVPDLVGAPWRVGLEVLINEAGISGRFTAQEPTLIHRAGGFAGWGIPRGQPP